MMRLGFYYHIPAVSQGGKILMPGYIGRFLDSLGDYFECITIFQHVPDPLENINLDYTMRSENIKLVTLPCRGSVPNRILHKKRFLGKIAAHINECDAFLIRGPTPLLPAIAKAVNKIPTIILIVGDQLAGVDSLPQPGWRKELIRVWSWYNAQRQLQVAHRCLVFVNSHVLYEQFEGKVKNLVETRTTTLTNDDFFQRQDTCLAHPIHLLYTGRMDPAKGLLDMVVALGILVGQGVDVVLDLVGWAEKGSNILIQIDQVAIQAGVKERILYHGYKAVGPELFAYYKAADIYLIASQKSEGFPRTIWEAMAHSLPVVATRVGSIPDFIEEAAVLTEPKNPTALVSGITQMINDTVMRKNIIRAGLLLASTNTLEVQVCEMSRIIHNWINERNE